MLPHKHLAVSAALGVLGWLKTGKPSAMLYAVVPGVLPDLDHAADYLYYATCKEHRLILPLHAYEYLVPMAIAAIAKKNNLLWLAAASYLIHLLSDQAENKTRFLGYSILYRIWHGFQLDRISSMPEAAARGRMADIVMLTNLVRRVMEFLKSGNG